MNELPVNLNELLPVFSFKSSTLMAEALAPRPMGGKLIFAFMDGSGDDCISEKLLDRWHTWAAVMAKAPHLSSQDLSKSFHMHGISLRKWSGVDPHKPKKALNRMAKNTYKANVKKAILLGNHDSMLIRGWSYRGRELLAMKRILYDLLKLEYVNSIDQQWRTVVEFTNLKYHGKPAIMLEGNAVVLVDIAAQLIALYSHLAENCEKIGVEDMNLCIVTDPLCGDNYKSKFHGDFVMSLLNRIAPGKIHIMHAQIQDLRVGEQLADNIAGWLQETITDGIDQAQALADEINQSPRTNLMWNILDKTHQHRVLGAVKNNPQAVSQGV